MKIKEITSYLESIAPRSLQEPYDNAGLITGKPVTEVTGVLTTLDCLESTVEEAILKNCNLIVAHHPIVFKGLKRLNGSNYVERTVIKAIQNDIAIYAIHTNLDNVYNGVNQKIAQKLELVDCRVLAEKEGQLEKIVVFVPKENAETVFKAMSEAGAGGIGNYDHCSFQLEGMGTFRPNELANPHIGQANQLERVEEVRIEMIVPVTRQRAVVAAMKKAHPYEEVAYYAQSLNNTYPEVGSGMIGELPKEMEPTEFLNYLKDKMDLKVIRFTETGKKIKKVALCGGAGGFQLPVAKARGAQAFVTADYKYHEFFDGEGEIMIADIGHFESERFTIELLADLITQKFPSLQVLTTEVNTNPVGYFY